MNTAATPLVRTIRTSRGARSIVVADWWCVRLVGISS